jgi:hypothetical protein
MGYHGRCFASYIVKKQDFFAAKGLVLGVIDFFRGVTGPGRYAKQLNAAHKNRVAC